MIGQNPSTLNRPGWISALSRPLGNQLMLVVAPHAANPLMLELAARLAVEQPLRVLDGGNRFNVYPGGEGCALPHRLPGGSPGADHPLAGIHLLPAPGAARRIAEHDRSHPAAGYAEHLPG